MKFLRVWCSLGVTVLAMLAGCGPNRTGFDAGSMDSGSMTMDTGMMVCPAPRAICGTTCADLTSDRQNCGGCGQACMTGYVCSAGHCSLSCPTSETACGTTCALLMTDNLNCGTCGHGCAPGLVCAGGTCGLSCGSALTSCTVSASGDGGASDGSTTADAAAQRYCANTDSDRRNCGGCGHACDVGEICSGGTCMTQCPATQTYCGTLCVNVNNDPANCGTCGHACNGQVCASGACSAVCTPGQTYCTDRCQDTQNDANNCGGCGVVCPSGQVCSSGTCAQVCPPDQMMCGSFCVSAQTDPTNCGTCGTVCGAGQTCIAGACTTTCAPGSAACGATCTNLSTDIANCGECGHACITGQFCSGGSCGIACAPGQTNCLGICVETAVDPANCGVCGVACGPGYGCVAGACTPFVGTDASGCSPPSLMCGPSCTNILNDNNNCGGCGRPCSTDRVCFMGMCLAPCDTGNIRCGTTCTDIRYDRNNCGACGTACASTLSCVNGLCSPEPTFEVTSFGTTGCNEVDVQSTAGFDTYGLGVSLTRVFRTGSTATIAASASDVTGAVSIGTSWNAMITDMQTGTVYAMLDSTNTGAPQFLDSDFTFSQLGALDGTTGALGTTRITLSTPITLPAFTNSVGIFSGYGRMLIHTGDGTGARWYHIRLPSGLVTPLTMSGVPTPQPETCSFAYFGIAEYHEGNYFALYTPQDFPVNQIVRYRVSDGTTSTAAMFTSLGSACAIAFSPVRNRWYFTDSFNSDQFTPGGSFFESALGTCTGSYSTP